MAKANDQKRLLRIAARRLCLMGLLCPYLAFAQAPLATEDFECLIEPNMTVMVGAPTQGIIDRVEVSRSDLVEAGQVLATLKSNVEKAALEHSRVRATMMSEIQAREADLQLAQVNMQRIDELMGKGMIPRQQRDEGFAQLKVAQMAVKQALDNKRLYEHEYARAKEIVEQRVIRSPISGVVVEQRAYPGEFVYENPIVTIAQINPLRVEAILPASFFGQFKQGMLATIVPEIHAETSLSGEISSVDRLIDIASGTFSVYLELDNPDNTIPGGQRCTVGFQAAELGEAVAATQ
jgi:RND family efflux transporter MFP subunit